MSGLKRTTPTVPSWPPHQDRDQPPTDRLPLRRVVNALPAVTAGKGDHLAAGIVTAIVTACGDDRAGPSIAVSGVSICDGDTRRLVTTAQYKVGGDDSDASSSEAAFATEPQVVVWEPSLPNIGAQLRRGCVASHQLCATAT